MFKYKLPREDNEIGPEVECETENNSLIIIGANGSGKTKLGAWMEQLDSTIHRVGAQRSLNFGDYIQQKSFEQSTNLFLFGQEQNLLNKMGRWNNGRMTTTLLNDYEYILSALIALKNNQNDKFIQDCKDKDAKNQMHSKVPETVIDKLQAIWQQVFPQRDIDFEDAKVTATLRKQVNGVDTEVTYKGSEMSDGERVGLYLIAQCLCIPANKTIIIDEPEIHLHRSIMNRLWTAIENERQDCLFIYITHDTQFAANHRQAKKIWVKDFDGANHWEWKEITDSTLPEQLLLDIMGNRKKVLFVEGTADSYDTKLYSEIYKDYYVIPCGGCSSVIAFTKAMKATPQLHDLQCFGIIDRDYRGDHEITALKVDNIFTLQVAEVENLFLVEELLKFVNTLQGFNDETRIEAIKKYIIEDRFSNEINKQILESSVSELKFKFTTVCISKTTEEEARQALENMKTSISFDQVKTEQEQKFNAALSSNNYKQILAVFNRKNLITSIGTYFGLKDKDYCDFIIRQLHGKNAREIKDVITAYLPPEIAINAILNEEKVL